MDIEDKYYQILGVRNGASLKEITKAYKKLVVIHHPDKGGDMEKMIEINIAFAELKGILESKTSSSHQITVSKTHSDSKYDIIKTKLKCPKCNNGHIILIKNTVTGKGFFKCSNDNCNYNGGPFNQDLSLLNTLDYCKQPGCDGLIYELEGQWGKFTACTYFSKTGCKAGRKSKKNSDYMRIKTHLKCPECGDGDVILIKNTVTDKGFFACSNRSCDYNGGPFNQDESLLNTLDYCPINGCDGLTYEMEGKYGMFTACTYFVKTGCKGGR